MSAQPVFNPPVSPSVSDSLLIALFVAVIVHAVIIIGIGFNMEQKERINKSISITLVNSPSKNAPEKARFLAQENQQGAGSTSTRNKPEPLQQKIPSQGQGEKRIQPQKVTPKKPRNAQKLLTHKKSDVKLATAQKTNSTAISSEHAKISPDALARQIAQLGATIRHQHKSSEETRIKFLNSVSTHKYLAAQYIMDWQKKVERTGNLNYPEIARKKHFTGTLKMSVGINHDGSIYSIRISKSSGYKALDDAAKRIVKISAPFAPLPKELRKELDVLVITRVWQFSDESGMVAK